MKVKFYARKLISFLTEILIELNKNYPRFLCFLIRNPTLDYITRPFLQDCLTVKKKVW